MAHRVALSSGAEMGDRENLLQAYLVVLVELAGAKVGALFEATGARPPLLAQVRLDQAAIDAVALAWRSQRAELEARALARMGPAVVWRLGPTGAGETAGLLYLDRTQAGFPTVAQERVRDSLVEILTRRRPRALGPVLAQHDPEEGLREQLTLALSRCNGNVAAAARLLGISRQTLYERAERLSIAVASFRFR